MSESTCVFIMTFEQMPGLLVGVVESSTRFWQRRNQDRLICCLPGFQQR
jgi:hypothetical protein